MPFLNNVIINTAKNINEARPGANPLTMSVKDVTSKFKNEYIVEIVATSTEMKEIDIAVLLLISKCIGPKSK